MNHSFAAKVLLACIAICSGVVNSFSLFAQPAAPTLVFPKNGMVTEQTNVTFLWDPIRGALSYDLQYAENVQFTLNLQTQNLTSNSYTTSLTSGKKYFWRVRVNTAAGTSAWSAVYSFYVFSPADINVTTWYKSDYGIQTDISGNVQSWQDASGNNNHATQSTPAYRPLFVPSDPLINNKPLLRFDGTNDYLRFNTYLSAVRTVFWVIKEDDNATPRYRSLLGNYNNTTPFHRGCCNGNQFPGTVKYIYHPTYAAPAVVNGVTRVNGNVVDPKITNVPTTLSLINTRTTAGVAVDAFTIDRYPTLNEFRVWDGDLAEIIIFNDALSDSVISLVDEYLRSKYTPAVNLGANIIRPYRLCDTVVLSLNANFVSWTWSTPGQQGTFVTVTQPGSYRVEATDLFGRITRDTIIVDFVRPQVIQPTTICAGDSLVWDTGLSNAYTFQWQDGSTAPRYVIRQSGNYWVKITDSTGCTYTTPTISVTVDSFSVIADLGPDRSICAGQTIGLTSGAALATQYSWSTGSSDAEINVSVPGTYYLTATSANGCQLMDSVHISLSSVAPVADFEKTDTCVGIPVSFSDRSVIAAPNTIVAWIWSFGDGTLDSTNNPNPVHQYAAPGTYTVKLTAVGDNGCTNMKTKTLNVYPLPQPFFADSMVCAGIFYTFKGSATSTSGATITQWEWNFGDQSLQSGQYPTHQYDSVKTYLATLTVTDSRGCQNSFTRPVQSLPPQNPALPPSLIYPDDYLVLPGPHVRFDWQNASGAYYYRLEVSTEPTFISTVAVVETPADTAILTTLNKGTRYYWRVVSINLCGEETSSAVRTFTLFEPDVYTGLCLWLRSDRGVHVNSVSGGVDTVTDQSSAINHAVQADPVNRPQWISSVQELKGAPVLRFNGSGQYLKFNPINTIRTVFWVVKEDEDAVPLPRHLLGHSTIEPHFHRAFPPPDKSIYDDVYIKSFVAPLGTTWVNGVQVDPQSTKMPTRFSVIVTKTTANAEADCFSCDRPSLITENRYWDGDLAELLIYCQPLDDDQINTVTKYLMDKYAPPVNLGPDITLGYGVCTPTVLRAGNWFTKYQWSTGVNDTLDSVVVIGSGTVSVIATDIFGRTSVDEITISGGLQRISFADTVYLCLGDTLTWNTGLSHDYDFLWQDGSTDSFYHITLPGMYYVQVSDTNTPPCSVTSDTVVVLIDSFRVTATLGPDTNLCSGNRISLVAGNEEAVSYLWSNGSTLPYLHIQTTGDYAVTAINHNGCQMQDTIHVNIVGVAPSVNFSYTKSCFGDTIEFTDQSAPAGALVSWWWDFGDQTNDTMQNPRHFYTEPNVYPVRLLVQDTAGCLQDTVISIVLYPLPVARFTHDHINCAGSGMQFTDQSTVSSGQTINKWNWTFGDGNFHVNANPGHTYAAQGIYPVSLTVTTDKGCTATAFDTIEVFPELVVDFTAENLCFDNPNPVSFSDASPKHYSNVKWLWKFGDNGTSALKNPTHYYQLPGTYTVSLTATNAIGCQRTVSKTITLTSAPVVSFSTPVLCVNDFYRFEDNIVIQGQDSIVAWLWDFGRNDSVSTRQKPFYRYDSAGVYTVTLQVTTKNGCKATGSNTILIQSPPIADFTFTPQYGPSPLPVYFTNRSEGAVSYQWDFGDQRTSDEQNPVHIYEQDGVYTIQLIATNAGGCSDTLTRDIKVSVATLDLAVADVTADRTIHVVDGICSYILKLGVLVQNVGTIEDISRFDVQASNSRGGSFVETWTGTFTQRQVAYQFAASYVMNDCEPEAIICVKVSNPNGIADQNPLNDELCITLEDKFFLLGPIPNPVSEEMRMDMYLPVAGKLTLTLYNAIGSKVMTLLDTPLDAKLYYRYTFNVPHLPTGTYIIRADYRDEVYVVKFSVRH